MDYPRINLALVELGLTNAAGKTNRKEHWFD